MTKLKFDENGRLILPEHVKRYLEEQKRKEEEAQKFTKKLILKYIGSEFDGFMKCEFKIEVPKDVEGIRKKIIEVRDWVNKNVELKERARCWIKKDGNDYKLIISGRGADERCTWCRSFRTALNNSMFDLWVAVYQNEFCKFDEEGYRKVKKLD